MKNLLFILFLFFSSSVVFAQDEDEESYSYDEETEEVQEPELPKEIGLDLNFSASNFGGTGGLGLKLGFPVNEKLIVGPSLRYQYSWNYNGGNPINFSVYGGGGFLHYRFYKYLFAGTEIEFLSTPVNYTYVTNNRSFVPVVLIGGGFSYAFSENFRLNAGIMYDLVNHPNSPLRPGYVLRNSQGLYLPVVYRVAFFFPV